MKNKQTKKTISLSIDSDLVDKIKELKGRDSVSRYISRLIEIDSFRSSTEMNLSFSGNGDRTTSM